MFNKNSFNKADFIRNNYYIGEQTKQKKPNSEEKNSTSTKNEKKNGKFQIKQHSNLNLIVNKVKEINL